MLDSTFGFMYELFDGFKGSRRRKATTAESTGLHGTSQFLWEYTQLLELEEELGMRPLEVYELWVYLSMLDDKKVESESSYNRS